MSLWRRAAVASMGSRALRGGGMRTGWAGVPAASALGRLAARPGAAPAGGANAALQRHLHARALSTSAGIPRFMFKLVRLPMYGIAAGGGVYAYTNYKLDEWKGVLGGLYQSASDGATDAFESLSSMSAAALGSARGTLDALRESIDGVEAPGWFSAWDGGGDGRDGGADTEHGGGAGGSGGGPGAAAAAAAVAAAVDDDHANGEKRESSEELMLLTRKLIEVRNILKSIDHDSDQLTLPSIVVIGSQSSGKSSVLEAIVGHEFLPKGNNMVTRRPIELTLVHESSDAVRAEGVVEYAEFPGLGGGPVTDFARVQKMLYDMNMAVPQAECVSADPIELHIHSPHVPDLSLIDLPGYVQLSSMDQPEELREKIAALCNKYIQEPNIILAVCAADVDLANSPALRASRKVDPLGVRTIGVITKMDLVPAEEGAAILNNSKYPLSLGYVGVICRPPVPTSSSLSLFTRNNNVVQLTQAYEREYFDEHHAAFEAPKRGRHAGVAPMVGTGTLRHRLMVVLEEHMGASLSGVANTVRSELDDAAYQFKVQYNDRTITAESYVAEAMDAMKQRFKYFAQHFGKPEVRVLLKSALDDKVMDILAQVYWTDGRVPELSALGGRWRVSREEVGAVWDEKLDASSGALTKSGVGRMSTQLVANTIRAQLEQLALADPFNYHVETAERIIAYGSALLRDRFAITADQVENCVKPYKYEVEMDTRDWEEGRLRSVQLMNDELAMCTEAYGRLRKAVGGRRLRGAVEYITQLEDRERARLTARLENDADVPLPEDDQMDPTRPGFNAALLMKAREARFLEHRADILRLRAAALKSRRCRQGPESKVFCPEAFLNVVADKLTYTAVMFINLELLAEFFYQFPREIDARLGYDMSREDMVAFARENPTIRKHIDVQERKEKLEVVMRKLDDLMRLYNEKQPPRQSSSKWLFF
ncbi:mitochondrial dynamin GTPase Msp1 [Malassezia sp. CBS 17886]|nr:mitochondrial dynamin GTPase Msp1 [Malassezia sp. CBS 17886]